MSTISAPILAPYCQLPASPNILNFENTHVYDLPWITRAVKSQVAIPLPKFLDALLPEYSQASTDSDLYIADTIREYNDSDPKASFPQLFKIFTENPNPLTLDKIRAGNSNAPARKVPERAITEFDLEGKNTGFNGVYYANEGRFKDVWHCLAKRASEAMSTGIPRNHIYGVYVEQEYAYFLYYDHSAVIVSEPMNWVKEELSFWKVMYIVSRIDLDRMGCATKFVTFPDLGLNLNGMKFTFIDVVQQNEEILGECTSMVHARVVSDGPWKDTEVTIKFGFIPREKGWKDEGDMVSDLRGKLPRLTAFLPVVIRSTVFSVSEIEGEVCKLIGNEYQKRELRVTVYAGRLYPVTSLLSDLDILRVFRDVMKLLHGMYFKHSLFHRSLNPGTILFRKVGNNIRGVLTGFQLCAHSDNVADGSAPSCLDAVESSPFLSPDILNNTRICRFEPKNDCHRYDLESIYYVLFFIGTHYENGKRVPGIKPPFSAWFEGNYRQVGSSKMVHALIEKQSFKTTPSLEKLQDKIAKLHYRLHYGYDLRKKSNKEEEVLFFMNDFYFNKDLFRGIPE